MVYRVEEYPTTLSHRYHLLGVIGSGGTGVVWRAHDEVLNRQVACKVLPGDHAVDSAFADRFERETRLVASLSHRNVVKVFDAGIDDGFAYLVMEYVRGGSLRQILRRSELLHLDVVATLAVEVLSALAEAHRMGIIHRDIKPANLLLDLDGNIKVADFGLAKSLSPGSADLTSEGIFVGTSTYASPEQHAGSSVGPPSDLYSLGCVVYQCIVGAAPEVGTNVETLRHALSSAPVSPGVSPETLRAITAATLIALATEPGDRFPDASSMSLQFAPLAREGSLEALVSNALLPDLGENTKDSVPRTLEHHAEFPTVVTALEERSRDRDRPRRLGRWMTFFAIGVALLLVATIGIWMLTRPSTTTPPTRTAISSGGYLRPGRSIQSPNGQFKLNMQSDGNLVISSALTKAVRWQTGTSGNFGAYVVMQADGNLVVYPHGRSAPAPGQPTSALWQSGTYGVAAASADLMDSGYLTVRNPHSDHVVWRSGPAK